MSEKQRRMRNVHRHKGLEVEGIEVIEREGKKERTMGVKLINV